MMLSMRPSNPTMEQIEDNSRHAWYSARKAVHVGFDVYDKYGDGDQLLHVTHLSESAERFVDWGDEVYVGVTSLWYFVRHVVAEPLRMAVAKAGDANRDKEQQP